MNIAIRTDEQIMRDRHANELRVATAARQKLQDLRDAVRDAEVTVARGPERTMQLQALLANLTAQKAAIMETVGRRLFNRGAFDRDAVLAELGKILVAETYGKDLLGSASAWCVGRAKENLARLRTDLEAAEKSQPA